MSPLTSTVQRDKINITSEKSTERTWGFTRTYWKSTRNRSSVTSTLTANSLTTKIGCSKRLVSQLKPQLMSLADLCSIPPNSMTKYMWELCSVINFRTSTTANHAVATLFNNKDIKTSRLTFKTSEFWKLSKAKERPSTRISWGLNSCITRRFCTTWATSQSQPPIQKTRLSLNSTCLLWMALTKLWLPCKLRAVLCRSNSRRSTINQKEDTAGLSWIKVWLFRSPSRCSSMLSSLIKSEPVILQALIEMQLCTMDSLLAQFRISEKITWAKSQNKIQKELRQIGNLSKAPIFNQ